MVKGRRGTSVLGRFYVTPCFWSDPIGGSELDLGGSVTNYYKLRTLSLFIHIMLNISLVIYSIAADYKIYTSSIYGSVQHLPYLHCLQKKQKDYYIYKIYQKVFRWASNYVLTLEANVDYPVLCFLLLYYTDETLVLSL